MPRIDRVVNGLEIQQTIPDGDCQRDSNGDDDKVRNWKPLDLISFDRRPIRLAGIKICNYIFNEKANRYE